MTPRPLAVKHGFISKISGYCSTNDVIAPWPDMPGHILFTKKCSQQHDQSRYFLVFSHTSYAPIWLHRKKWQESSSEGGFGDLGHFWTAGKYNYVHRRRRRRKLCGSAYLPGFRSSKCAAQCSLARLSVSAQIQYYNRLAAAVRRLSTAQFCSAAARFPVGNAAVYSVLQWPLELRWLPGRGEGFLSWSIKHGQRSIPVIHGPCAR